MTCQNASWSVVAELYGSCVYRACNASHVPYAGLETLYARLMHVSGVVWSLEAFAPTSARHVPERDAAKSVVLGQTGVPKEKARAVRRFRVHKGDQQNIWVPHW